MAQPFGRLPGSLDNFVGVIPLAATLRSSGCHITISAIEVFEDAVSARLLATLIEGFDLPKFDAPEDFVEQTFIPKWIIPIDLTRLVPAKEIDAR